ncbi:hypothetical protein WICPIJ_005173 [Wickerhamomyces pijperi]|uniref:Transmembrane 9 superfamily member n=1 Tax=Wickerhamomyces pijperi TaxID=599730 RepID=A0A9P8TML5_WICPI|nr:hypothetical protein WICPIJ_005173 [Wickerhamomyces pijperi]
MLNLPLTLLGLLSATQLVDGFYLPGVTPTTYKEGDSVPLLVNHLTPPAYHEMKYAYSFDYYFEHLHFCQPPELVKQSESLGAIIFGDRIYNSPFELTLLKDESCKQLCSSSYPAAESSFVNALIKDQFSYNWLIDGLPAARRLHDQRTNSDFYGAGFELGQIDETDPEVAHLINHFDIQVEYHQRGENEYRIVGVTVVPYSIERQSFECPSAENVDSSPKVTLSNKEEARDVYFTYDVRWVASETAWATRWDKYLHVYDPKVQWFSLINFSLVVICLSLVLSHILLGALRKDIARYNEVNLDDDYQDQTGWKLVHGDVFRKPRYLLILSVIVGSGIQLFLMTLVTLGFALMGLLSPSNRGSLSTVMFILYALFGSVGSFVSGTVYKFFGGEDWRLNMLLTPLLIPGIIFGCFIGLNFFLISAGSSGAIPFGTVIAIVAIWVVISVPCSVFGSILALKREAPSQPVKTNQIPRQIPTQPRYLSTIVMALVAGVFPFGAIAVEMYFIYSSIWSNKIFYMFGFLFFCFVLMAATTALVTILMTYYTLCSENYQWQWRSIIVAGGCSVYMFVHAIFLSKFEFGGITSIVLYIGYSLLISFLAFVITGSIGFLSTLIFVRKIYGAVRVD